MRTFLGLPPEAAPAASGPGVLAVPLPCCEQCCSGLPLDSRLEQLWGQATLQAHVHALESQGKVTGYLTSAVSVVRVELCFPPRLQSGAGILQTQERASETREPIK